MRRKIGPSVCRYSGRRAILATELRMLPARDEAIERRSPTGEMYGIAAQPPHLRLSRFTATGDRRSVATETQKARAAAARRALPDKPKKNTSRRT